MKLSRRRFLHLGGGFVALPALSPSVVVAQDQPIRIIFPFAAGGSGDGLEVEVDRAEGQKCARCWRVVPEVSTSPGTEGLCDRCLAAISGT